MEFNGKTLNGVNRGRSHAGQPKGTHAQSCLWTRAAAGGQVVGSGVPVQIFPFPIPPYPNLFVYATLDI